jgi:hypothetical protein
MKRSILVIICMVLMHCSFAQWAGMGTGPGGKVRALCVHNGELYAGGDFTGLVKKWNGTSWVAVGSLSGTTSPKVCALISYNGSLYAGGAFSLSASNFNVAKWTGSTWTTVGDGLQGVSGSEVKAFCNYQGALIAGGTFTQSGTSSLSKVGKLVGNAWAQVGGGAPPNCTAGVHALAVHSSELYVAGEGSAPWINKLNLLTGQWSDLPNGLSQGVGVYALQTFKYPNATTPTLFIGGSFSAPFTNCCSYSNGNWGTVLNPFAGTKVSCLLASSSGSVGSIYAGGIFTVQGATNLAKKGITTPWAAEGTNTFNNAVLAMCFFSGYVVAGGDFTSPGTNIARFATTIGIDELNENIIVNSVFPNPVIKNALLKVQTKDEMLQPELMIMDGNGNEISNHVERTGFNRSQNEVEFRIDREGLASGFYFYMVIDEQQNVASGKFIVE